VLRVVEKCGENTKAELLRKQEKALQRLRLFFDLSLIAILRTMSNKVATTVKREDGIKASLIGIRVCQGL
jgi:hypothetical protein